MITAHQPHSHRRTTCDRETALCTKVHCAVKSNGPILKLRPDFSRIGGGAQASSLTPLTGYSATENAISLFTGIGTRRQAQEGAVALTPGNVEVFLCFKNRQFIADGNHGMHMQWSCILIKAKATQNVPKIWSKIHHF